MQTAAHVAPNKTHQIHTRGRGGVTVPNKTKTTLTKSIMMWCKVIGDRYNKRQQSRHGVPEEVHQRVSLPRAKATEIRAQHGIGSAPQATQQATKQQRQAKKKRRRRTGRQAGNKSTSQLCRPMNRATSLQADIGVAFQAFGPIKNTQTTPLKPFFSN